MIDNLHAVAHGRFGGDLQDPEVIRGRVLRCEAYLDLRIHDTSGEPDFGHGQLRHLPEPLPGHAFLHRVGFRCVLKEESLMPDGRYVECRRGVGALMWLSNGTSSRTRVR